MSSYEPKWTKFTGAYVAIKKNILLQELWVWGWGGGGDFFIIGIGNLTNWPLDEIAKKGQGWSQIMLPDTNIVIIAFGNFYKILLKLQNNVFTRSQYMVW